MVKIKNGHRLRSLHSFAAEKISGNSLVEVYGSDRIVLENHKGVIEYAGERICIKVLHGCIRICGKKLVLAQMSAEQLVIMGQIDSIFFVKRGA